MKLDGVINNVYFKQSIRGNTDNITEDEREYLQRQVNEYVNR